MKSFAQIKFWAVILTAIFLYTLNRSTVYAQPLEVGVPYDRLKHFEWLLIVQISQGVFGIVYNAVCLISMLSLDKSSKMSFYSINVFLNCMDLAFCIGRVLFSSIYYHYSYFYGEDISCRSEAYFTLWTVFTSILAIVGMSWVARNDICNGNKVTEKQMISYMGSTATYAAIGVGICIYIPYGGFELESTGTYCFVAVSSYAGAPFLTVNFIGWLLFLLYNARKTFSAIKESQAILEKHAIKEQAKGRYLNMVKKMEYFLHTTLNLYAPVVVGGWYQWITGIYVPGIYSAISGIIATCVPTLVNPSLFFYLNADLREKFWQVFGYHFARFLQNLGLLKLIGKILIGRALILNNRSRKLQVMRVSSVVTLFDSDPENRLNNNNHVDINNIKEGHPNICDYNDVNVWLSDPILLEALKDHGRKEYALENFLFFEDAQLYFQKGLEIKSLIEDRFEDGLTYGIILEKWKEFQSLSLKIYTLYISVPTAPLEINIASSLQKSVAMEFETKTDNDAKYVKPSLVSGSKRTGNRISPDKIKTQIAVLENLTKEEAMLLVDKHLHLFDECVKVVKKIIESDIWPRFRITSLKRDTVKKHKQANMPVV